MRTWLPLLAGLGLLAFAWLGPLPGLVPASFAAHMSLHMLVVGMATPLLALGLAQRFEAKGATMALPLVASIADFVVIWLWHVPGLHHAARSGGALLALEQANFAMVALLVWLVALAGPPLAGALSLFFTAMHMTLLGTLLALAPRPLYPGHHGSADVLGLDALADQQLGGTIMLAVGGAVYLTGGLWLAAGVVRSPAR